MNDKTRGASGTLDGMLWKLIRPALKTEDKAMTNSTWDKYRLRGASGKYLCDVEANCRLMLTYRVKLKGVGGELVGIPRISVGNCRGIVKVPRTFTFYVRGGEHEGWYVIPFDDVEDMVCMEKPWEREGGD